MIILKYLLLAYKKSLIMSEAGHDSQLQTKKKKKSIYVCDKPLQPLELGFK